MMATPHSRQSMSTRLNNCLIPCLLFVCLFVLTIHSAFAANIQGIWINAISSWKTSEFGSERLEEQERQASIHLYCFSNDRTYVSTYAIAVKTKSGKMYIYSAHNTKSTVRRKTTWKVVGNMILLKEYLTMGSIQRAKDMHTLLAEDLKNHPGRGKIFRNRKKLMIEWRLAIKRNFITDNRNRYIRTRKIENIDTKCHIPDKPDSE